MAPKTQPKGTPDKDDPPADAKPKKFRLPIKKILFQTLGVVGFGAASYGGWTYVASHHDSRDQAPVAKPAVFVDLPEVLVNLSNTGSDRTQYLKVRVVLELPDQMLMAQIQPVMPRVLDTFQTYLRELRPTDLDGSSGLYRLKEELTRRVNAAIAPNKVTAVLFKEIVVQ
jgi:flagellar protein FliL